jgi:aryl-alcohol dehydrogenase-like predicted oxidoreductase
MCEGVVAAAVSAAVWRRDFGEMSVALAWLLQRSPNMLLIPGTSSVEHLREKMLLALAFSCLMRQLRN